MLLRLAWREILNNKRFATFFCLNLALGLTGFLVIDAFKGSLLTELGNSSKKLLAADISITSISRPLSQQEEQLIDTFIPSGSQRVKITSLFSMAVTPSTSRLVNVYAVSAAHPLYGDLRLKDQGLVSAKQGQQLNQEAIAWVYPELLIQLGLQLGDSLKIGYQSFRIVDVIEQDPTSSASAFAFAPRVYIGQAFIPATKLVISGSRYRERHLYRLPAEKLAYADAVLTGLKQSLPASDVRIRSHREASQNISRSLNYLTDYLGLVALVALFLAALGSAYLYRGFLNQRFREIATLMSLGATNREARYVYALQLLILGMIAALLTVSFALLCLPVIPDLVAEMLPIALKPQVSLASKLIVTLMATFGSLLLCQPLLMEIKQLQPAALFQESQFASAPPKSAGWLWYVPMVALYWGLAIWQAQSIPIGSLFIIGLLTASLLFSRLSHYLFAALAHWGRSAHLALRLALRNLSRNRRSTGACFLTIALGTLLIAVVPQIQQIILEEVSRPAGFSVPSLFLVDIQEDQLTELNQFIKHKESELVFPSPLIRARLTQKNGVDIEKMRSESVYTREQQNEQWVRNRGYNLSYQPNVKASETIISGREFSGSYTDPEKPAELSVEMRFAQRLGISLGDRLTFDVQGVPVEGRVINIRRIKWTSFQPNFFVQFQPGVLDEAPKTFIGAIPALSLEKKVALQTAIVQQFPNISIVDIASTVSRILDIIDKMAWIVRIMAYFTLFAGVTVLFSIASHQAALRRWDTNLLKVLGGKFADIYGTLFWEFGLLGFMATAVGASASFLISFFVSRFVFRSPWLFQPLETCLLALAITAICLLTTYLATRKTLHESPLALLNKS